MEYGRHTVHVGDNIELLATLDDNSIDAVVTDPPYGLGKQPDALAMLTDWLDSGHHDVGGSGFMGRKWDAFVPQPAFWREVFRVLKPGGHVLSFFGARTYDVGVLAMRLAGFEIRDCVFWCYGSGFPKSHNISKALDKAAGAEREVGPERFHHCSAYPGRYHSLAECSGRPSSRPSQVPDARECNDEAPRHLHESIPATEAAQQWDGWGTALKPAVEPIVVARKPLDGTVAGNVLKWSVGGLNVDGCRVAHDEECRMMAPSQANIDSPSEKCRQAGRRAAVLELKPAGRFPANLIHDGSEEVVGLFPVTGAASRRPPTGKPKYTGSDSDSCAMRASATLDTTERGHNDNGGSAARYFYCAKANKRERAGSRHPTVKPLALMRYLVRLVTPPDGTVLDPFLGSGTTLLAAEAEGFRCVGAEAEHGEDIATRWAARSAIIEHSTKVLDKHPTTKPVQAALPLEGK